MLTKELAAEVFACLTVEKQELIINGITDNELKLIIDDLYVDDAVDMMEELPATIVKRVLKNAAPDTRQLIDQFLNYPENSAGSIMTAEYVGLKKAMTVEELRVGLIVGVVLGLVSAKYWLTIATRFGSISDEMEMY